MMRQRKERPAETERKKYCPFDNPNCAVTCECGDDECHRYCVGQTGESGGLNGER